MERKTNQPRVLDPMEITERRADAWIDACKLAHEAWTPEIARMNARLLNPLAGDEQEQRA